MVRITSKIHSRKEQSAEIVVVVTVIVVVVDDDVFQQRLNCSFTVAHLFTVDLLKKTLPVLFFIN